jgi:hypothetical protein
MALSRCMLEIICRLGPVLVIAYVDRDIMKVI